MFLAALVVAISFLAACSGGSKDTIVSKWKISDIQSPQMDRGFAKLDAQIAALGDSITAAGADTTKAASFKSQKDMYESQKTMMNSMMDKMKAEGWMEFTKEGKFKQNFGGNEEEGTYSLDEAGKMLMTIDAKGNNDTLNIDELTASALTLSNPKDSTKIMFTADAGEAK